MKKLLAGVVALLIVGGVSIGVAKGVFGTGETTKAPPTPVLAAEKKNDASPVKKPAAPANQKPATALMEEAAKANKYLFGFFWKTENDQTTAMKKVFEDAVAKVSDRPTAAIVQITDPAEKEIVKKFGLDRAPMPLALDRQRLLRPRRGAEVRRRLPARGQAAARQSKPGQQAVAVARVALQDPHQA